MIGGCTYVDNHSFPPEDAQLQHPLRRALEGAPTKCRGEEKAAHGPHVDALVDGGVGLHLLFVFGLCVSLCYTRYAHRSRSYRIHT